MLRALFPQRLRSCGPAFGFLARVLGAYVLDIVICEIAGFEGHCNPVHSGSGAFLRTKRCRNASGSCRHEGATTKRCHIDLPGYWGSAAANPRFATTSPTEHPNASPLSELCKLFPILQGQLASFTLFALVWDMPLFAPKLGKGLERRMTITLRSGLGGFLKTAMCELRQVENLTASISSPLHPR